MANIYHCSDSGGFGAFVASAIAAYAISILTNHTYILGSNCNTEARSLNIQIAFYMDILVQEVPKSAQVIHFHNHPIQNVMNETHLQDNLLNAKDVCLINSEHTALDKVFRGKQGQNNMARLGCKDWKDCFTMLKKKLFRPSHHLISIYKKWYHTFEVPSDYSVLHVRLGDGNILRNTTTWRWKTEQRRSFFRSDPNNCLLNIKNSVNVVLSDTEWVRRIASSFGFITMPTNPIHMGSNKHFNSSDIDGLFLEWYLMFKANVCYTYDGSMFSNTACSKYINLDASNCTIK